MKILFIITILILIYVIYQLYKENQSLKQENIELGFEIDDNRKLLEHIAYRSAEYAGKQWYRSSNIGFRAIKEMAQNKTLDFEGNQKSSAYPKMHILN